MKERKHKFTIPPFGYTVEIVLTDSIHASRKQYDEYIGSSSEYVSGTKGMHTYNYHFPKSIIILHENFEFVTAIHEAFHAVAAMYRFYDTPLKNATEEVYAYTLDYMVQQILDFKKR